MIHNAAFPCEMNDEAGSVPEEIICSDQVFDVSFHPKTNILAAGLIDGSVDVWKYESEGALNSLLFKSNKHVSSCRGVCFNVSGDILYTISSDKSLQGLNGNGQQTILYDHAHDVPINRLCEISEHTVVTGDDSGEVKLWDIRVGSGAVMCWKEHEDFISGLAYHEENSSLLSISGDATLCYYDIRKKNIFNRSDEQESELQCLQVIKGGKKVICGTQDGVVLVFSWDRWGDCSDRYPGHPEAVDCMYKVDETTVITGSSDGFIRVVAIQPNKILGVIGDHEEFPVEGMRGSRDNRLLGSYAHDEIVRFWDISMFADDVPDAEDDDEQYMKDEEGGPDRISEALYNGKKTSNNKGNSNSKHRSSGAVEEENDDEMMSEEGDEDGWEDEENEGSDEDDDDEMNDSSEDSCSDDEESDSGGKGPKMLPTASEKFFADL